MFKKIRKNLITGIVLILPLIAVLFVLNILLTNIGAPASEYLFFFFNGKYRNLPLVNEILSLVSFFLVLLLMTLLGWISNYFLGRYFMSLTEKVMNKIPFLGSVYKTVKQIVETFKSSQNNAFQKTVLVEFPRPGLFSIGFVTGITKGEIQEKTAQTVVNVFVPTTPNPTSGFLILVPQGDIIDLEMSVGDGIKMIVSGGTLTPKPNGNKQVKSSESPSSLS